VVDFPNYSEGGMKPQGAVFRMNSQIPAHLLISHFSSIATPDSYIVSNCFLKQEMIVYGLCFGPSDTYVGNFSALYDRHVLNDDSSAPNLDVLYFSPFSSYDTARLRRTIQANLNARVNPYIRREDLKQALQMQALFTYTSWRSYFCLPDASGRSAFSRFLPPVGELASSVIRSLDVARSVASDEEVRKSHDVLKVNRLLGQLSGDLLNASTYTLHSMVDPSFSVMLDTTNMTSVPLDYAKGISAFMAIIGVYDPLTVYGNGLDILLAFAIGGLFLRGSRYDGGRLIRSNGFSVAVPSANDFSNGNVNMFYSPLGPVRVDNSRNLWHEGGAGVNDVNFNNDVNRILIQWSGLWELLETKYHHIGGRVAVPRLAVGVPNRAGLLSLGLPYGAQRIFSDSIRMAHPVCIRETLLLSMTKYSVMMNAGAQRVDAFAQSFAHLIRTIMASKGSDDLFHNIRVVGTVASYFPFACYPGMCRPTFVDPIMNFNFNVFGSYFKVVSAEGSSGISASDVNLTIPGFVVSSGAHTLTVVDTLLPKFIEIVRACAEAAKDFVTLYPIHSFAVEDIAIDILRAKFNVTDDLNDLIKFIIYHQLFNEDISNLPLTIPLYEIVPPVAWGLVDSHELYSFKSSNKSSSSQMLVVSTPHVSVTTNAQLKAHNYFSPYSVIVDFLYVGHNIVEFVTREGITLPTVKRAVIAAAREISIEELMTMVRIGNFEATGSFSFDDLYKAVISDRRFGVLKLKVKGLVSFSHETHTDEFSNSLALPTFSSKIIESVTTTVPGLKFSIIPKATAVRKLVVSSDIPIPYMTHLANVETIPIMHYGVDADEIFDSMTHSVHDDLHLPTGPSAAARGLTGYFVCSPKVRYSSAEPQTSEVSFLSPAGP